jgi:N utilization substance protein A
VPELSFDAETLGYIRIFEERTGAGVKDCFESEGKLLFLVAPGEIPKAVGPAGAVIDRLKELLKKEIQVIEYSDDAETLVRNIFYAFGATKVEIAPKGNGRHATVTVDPAWKARAIGKAGKNLKLARSVLMRHTDIHSVSVA